MWLLIALRITNAAVDTGACSTRGRRPDTQASHRGSGLPEARRPLPQSPQQVHRIDGHD
jgi:hypothetical protein